MHFDAWYKLSVSIVTGLIFGGVGAGCGALLGCRLRRTARHRAEQVAPPAVVVAGLGYRFVGRDEPSLADVSFSLPAGTITVVGRSHRVRQIDLVGAPWPD